MALHTDTEIYRATYDLTKMVTAYVANMERNYRADFGAELRRRCMTLVMRTYEANTSDDKPPILRRMRQEVEAVNLSLRLVKDLKQISNKQYGNAIALSSPAWRTCPTRTCTRAGTATSGLYGKPATATTSRR